MPESSCLHIQDSASGPIRVLEIPWPLVRIGRAALCEVRLNDPDLAGEICRLQRRGGNWQIEPLVADVIRLDGRPVNGVRLLPYDTPIHIGAFCLTLHASKLAAPDWGSYQSLEPDTFGAEPAVKIEAAAPASWDVTPPLANKPRQSPEIGTPLASEPARPSPVLDVPSVGIDRGAEAEQPASALREQRRWENRWRAAGEKLRAASPPKTPRSSIASKTIGTIPTNLDRPLPRAVPQVPRLEQVPLKEVLLPRPPMGRSTPTAREFGEWTLPGRPEQVSTPPISPPDLESPNDLDRQEAEVAIPVASGQSEQPGDGKSINLTGRGIDHEEPPVENGPISEPVSDDPSTLNPPSRQDFREGLAASNPASDLSARDHQETAGDRAEPSVDARISAWNPSWFDGPLAPDGAEAASASLAASEEEFRFTVGTEWVAPAECLGAITTSFESPRHEEAPAGFTTAKPGPERLGTKPQSVAPLEESIGTDRPVAGATPVSPAGRPGSALIPDPESDVPRHAFWSSRASDLTSTPLARPIEDAMRRAPNDWPSVDDILAAHRPPPSLREDSGGLSAASRGNLKQGRGPNLAAPSLARGPDCWELPLWLGWPPLAAVSLLACVLACAMSWSWMQEARNVSVVANRLLGKEADVINGRPIPLPEWVVPPSPTWYRSSARHLTYWAAYLGRSAESGERGEEIREFLDGAVGASPVYAPARLALARLEGAGLSSTHGLGLSRDPIALAWTAQRLLKAGRKDVALPLYHRALLLATRPEFSPEAGPKFADDPQAKRYLLPGEDVVREILSGLANERGVNFAEWSSILPEGTVAPLVAARLLKSQSLRDAEAALELILGHDAPSGPEGASGAIRHAVRAEAFAIRGNLKDAGTEYRAAIEDIDHDATRRSWWFNLADIAQGLKDEVQRQEAIKKVLASTTMTDDIARRAADLRRGQPTPTAQVPPARGAGLKAN